MKDAEVKKALEKICSDYDGVIKEQRERILRLRAENQKLAGQLESSRKREEQAAETLALAAAKAREIESAAKLRYRTEVQRLREFHIRWKKYYDELGGRAPVEDRVQMRRMLERMDGIFEGEFLLGEEDFSTRHDAERERVEKSRREDFDSGMDAGPTGAAAEDGREGAASVAPGSAAFDLDEVLYPKNLPNLETLCRELGLEGKGE